MFMQILEKCDIFGNGIGLNMNYNSIYKTKVGGFLSIIVVLIIAAYFWTNFVIFINQTKLTVTSEKAYNVNPTEFTIGAGSMMFGINIYQPNLDFLTNPYFNINLSVGAFQNLGTTFVYNYYPVELEPCTKQHFIQYADANNVTKNQEIDIETLETNFICPKLGTTFTLSGQYLSPNFDFLRIQVTPCTNEDLASANPNWKATCAPADQVEAYLKANGNYRVSVYNNNFLISPDKASGYSESYVNEDLSFLFIPNQMFKSVDVFFRDYQIQTTSYGLLTSTQTEETYIVYDYKDFTESTTLGSQSSVYTEIFLRRSPYTQYYYRDHQNFTQFLSSFGGFINILVTCIGLFMRRYNYFQFTVDLANKLYNFKFQDSPHTKNTITSSDNNNASNFNHNNDNQINKDVINHINHGGSTINNNNHFNNTTNMITNTNQNTQTKHDTLKYSTAKLTHSKINLVNLSLPESPTKMSRKSSRAVDDITKYVVDSPQITYQKPPSFSEIAKSNNNFLSTKIPYSAANKPHARPSNSQQSQQPASFNQLNVYNPHQQFQKSKQNLVKSKMWKAIKLINTPGFNFLEYEKRHDQNRGGVIKQNGDNTILNVKLREQIKNYKQLGYQNKTDFLFNNFKEIVKKQQRKIRVSLTYFFRFFKFNYQYNSILHKARHNISQDLDIYTILQKLQEVDKIKRILFNKDQNVLFSFYQKPLISAPPKEPENPKNTKTTTTTTLNTIQDKQNTSAQNEHLLLERNADVEQIDTYQKLYLAFNKLRNKENKNDLHMQYYQSIQQDYPNSLPVSIYRINNRLIKELGEDIYEIFELSREVIKENEDNQRITQIDSFDNIFKQPDNVVGQTQVTGYNNVAKQQETHVNTFHISEHHNQFQKEQVSQNQSYLNSGFNSVNQLKLPKEVNDNSLAVNIPLKYDADDNLNEMGSQKTIQIELSLNKSTLQPQTNISFFDIDNKSQFAMIDTIPDIPFEPAPDDNINRDEFQKETRLKRIV